MIAHEVGHHVQDVLGILGKVQARQRDVGEREGNQLSVRIELMADCLAGVWAKNSNDKFNAIDESDVQAGDRGRAGDRRRPAAAAEPG